MEREIERFLKDLREVRGRAANTVLAYGADLAQMTRVLQADHEGPLTSTSITLDAILKYVEWLGGQGYRPTTVSRKMASVRAFLDYLAVEEGRSTSGIAMQLQPPPTPRRQPRILTMDEVKGLVEAAASLDSPLGQRDAAILAVLYSTGMRAADVVDLNIQDVDLSRSELARASNRSQWLPLGIAHDHLRKYLAEGRPNLSRPPEIEALFLNQRGRRLSRQGVWLVVKRWASALGLSKDVSPHTLRHTLASHMLSQGMTRRQVQRQLGLSSPNSVRVSRSSVGAY